MKITASRIRQFLTFVFVLVGVSIGSRSIATPPPAAPKSVTFQVQGMTCGSCVGQVRKALQSAQGVVADSVKVSLRTKTAEAMFSPDTDVPAIIKTFEAANPKYKLTLRQ